MQQLSRLKGRSRHGRTVPSRANTRRVWPKWVARCISWEGALMELSLATRSVSDHVVLEIGGEIDVYTAPRLRERLIEMVASGDKNIVVDLARVEFLDSTGLGVLV